MTYDSIITAVFIMRLNRFVAEVLIENKVVQVHVKNTGRCKELLIEGAKIILEVGKNPNRKLPYSIIAVYKGNILVSIDSQAPNAAVYEAMQNKNTYTNIKREVNFGNSRFDIYYEKNDVKGFVEVKGVNLEEDGVAMFPDAPTQRGTKHLNELITAKSCGFEAAVLFLVQFKDAKYFKANSRTDSNFAEALEFAYQSGVNIFVYDCIVTENSLLLNKPVDSDYFKV